MGVEQVELTLELARGQPAQLADEVAVDVVRVILVLHERTIDEDLGDADGGELTRQDPEVVDELGTPG